MKSHRDLWSSVVEWSNLVRAYRLCRRRKRFSDPACRFDFDWESGLADLQRELLAGAYQPGQYYHFFIHEPKRRKVSAAPFRDRVVHHAIVNVLGPVFERRFIFDSYACRVGKGTHRAIDRAQKYLRRFPYYLKTDIVKFFPNVDHGVLMSLLESRVREKPFVDLLRVVIASGQGILDDEATPRFFPGDDLFAMLRPRGLPIGNLTSQFFANVLLDPIDHFIKEELRVPGYVRYADDLIMFGASKRELWEQRDRVADRLALLRLRLHSKKTVVRPSDSGVAYLGFRLYPDSKRLTQDGIRRFARRLRKMRWQFRHGKIRARKIRESLKAWIAHTEHANSKGLRRELWKRVRFRRIHPERIATVKEDEVRKSTANEVFPVDP